jgi:hypothetical protein
LTYFCPSFFIQLALSPKRFSRNLGSTSGDSSDAGHKGGVQPDAVAAGAKNTHASGANNPTPQHLPPYNELNELSLQSHLSGSQVD